jgi:hypothetical protein
VLVVMAIAASVAYAWWTADANVGGNTVSTAGTGLEMGGLPITAAGLVPIKDPDIDANDAAYASVSYFFVHNTGSIPLMFYGFLSDGNDPNNINPYVRVRIWLQSAVPAPANWTGYPAGWADTFQTGGPYVAYDGTLGGLWTGAPAGINYLSSRGWTGSAWIDTPIGVNEYGVYRVAVWLDSGAPDSTQNSTVGFKINFHGMQKEAWDAAGYDTIPKF